MALNLGIVVGSTRPGRRADAVARWVRDRAARRDDVVAELLDIADFELPVLDEPVPAVHGRYEHPHTRAWADAIAGADAFVFVTPEYNRSIPGALKNALDFLYAEWHDKAAGFVSYGMDAGGARAVEHLRAVMAELHVADVRAHVALSLGSDFDADGRFAPAPHRDAQLEVLLDQVIAWGGALRQVREPLAAAR